MQQIDPYTLDPVEDEDEALPILELLQLLWFRRRLIFVITLLVGAVGYVKVNEMRNVYSATSSILIGVQQGQVTNSNNYRSSWWDRPQSEEEIQVLGSRSVAERVITDLNLTSGSIGGLHINRPGKLGNRCDKLSHSPNLT